MKVHLTATIARLKSAERSEAPMPRRKKYTARGTLRLTKKQRSQIMKQFWRERREHGAAPPEKPKKPLDEARSKRMKASWRRRRRAGTAPAKKKRILLTHEQRSEISKAAAALRRARSKRRKRAT
jgi:hypothetical protein